MTLSPYQPRGLVSAGDEGVSQPGDSHYLQPLQIETGDSRISRAVAAQASATVDVNQVREH